MKLLLLILSLMTFTIQDKHTVNTDGEYPILMQASYANTGTSGNVTAGQEAVLSLTHLGGIQIDRITVYANSNKSSGAGEFAVTADGQTITTKSGTFKQWTGGYDNTAYHPITLLQSPVAGVSELTITLTGTKNSLHINRYEIQWTPVAPRIVTLMRGDKVYATMTETQGNDGIHLPAVPDTEEWKFLGWSETMFWSSNSLPTLYPAATRYVPSADCTLWAVFEYQDEEQETGYATELTDGEYRYVNSTNNTVLTGVPADGGMKSDALNLSSANQIYSISFPDTATAYITHRATGTPIGYSGTKMAANTSPWKVYHKGEETIFYIEEGNKLYVLWLNIQIHGGSTKTTAGLMDVYSLSSPMRLLPVVESSAERYYTCHPEVPMGVEEVKDERMNELMEERVLMQLGTYQLKIRNGKKIIEL